MDKGKEPGRRGQLPWLADVGRASSLGIQFTATFLLFGLLGWWLDGRLGTYPLLMIVGIFLGAAGGFMKLYFTLEPPRGGKGAKRGGKP